MHSKSFVVRKKMANDRAVALISSAPLLLMLLAVMMESGSTKVSASAADVNIYNMMGDAIQVQCSGQGRDLGFRTIPAGQSYGWGFTPSIWWRTRYYCSFSWAQGVEDLRVWDDGGLPGVKQVRPCTHCEWRVYRSGFFRNERGRPPVFIHAWL